MKKSKLISLVMLVIADPQSVFANTYAPHVQFGGTQFFNTKEFNVVANFNLFMPIWHKDRSDLLFTDLRIHDHSGFTFGGSLQLGYRHLATDEQKIFGIYSSFDRKKTACNNYISQIGFGGEFWLNKWFAGVNLYKPIGSTTKYLSTNSQKLEIDSVTIREIKNFRFEKAIPGFDFEVGYEFIPGLIGYTGGYYFDASDIDRVCGPRVRLVYELTKYTYGKRVLDVFDVVGLELGMQHDKPRNTIYYANMHVRFGLNDNSSDIAKGISRHMIDPIHREIDIIYRPISSSIVIDKKRILKQLPFSPPPPTPAFEVKSDMPPVSLPTPAFEVKSDMPPVSLPTPAFEVKSDMPPVSLPTPAFESKSETPPVSILLETEQNISGENLAMLEAEIEPKFVLEAKAEPELPQNLTKTGSAVLALKQFEQSQNPPRTCPAESKSESEKIDPMMGYDGEEPDQSLDSITKQGRRNAQRAGYL